ncbi:choline transporter-like protein 1 [Lineus longissimus]|uniref:choline transporter-like protein 1 n=1 Tax=Lineus longissimus TaxID=88925 RepID=UPI002B4D3B69
MCGCCRSEDTKPDPDEADGTTPRNPLRNRGCTDIPMLLIFLAFIAGLIYITAFSIVNGNFRRLVYGYDSYGDTCGSENTQIINVSLSGKDLRHKNYLFYMDVLYPKTSMCICVSKCPDAFLTDIVAVKAFSNRTGSKLCDYHLLRDEYTPDKQSKRGPCPLTPIFESGPVLFRCIPSPTALLNNVTRQAWNDIIGFINESGVFQKVLADLYTSWPEMLGLCFIALVLSLLVSLFIRFVAGMIIWFVMVGSAVASTILTGVLWWVYVVYRNKLNEEEKMKVPLLDVEISNEKAFLAFSIISTILTVVLLLIIIVMRKRVALAVSLFNEAGRCLSDIPCLLFQPLFTFLILIAFLIYWVIVLAFISTADYPVIDKITGYVKYEDQAPIQYMWWYHIVALIWISEFILACEELVIAGSVAQWYFTRSKNDVSCPIGKSICRLITHHIGSAAFGAFIITLVKIPRMILMYLSKKLKGKQNKCAEFCMKCCICCLWCLEKCLKYLNRNAYIIIAIEGHSFCTSAKKAFETLVSNVLRVAAINGVGDFVLFLAKISIMASTSAIGVVIFRLRPDLHYYAVPVLLCCIFAYLVASVFLSVYEMVIDALLLCFCEDCQINDGTPGREYYMSSSLMEFVKKTSSKLDKLSRKKRDSPDGAGENLHPDMTEEKTSV